MKIASPWSLGCLVFDRLTGRKLPIIGMQYNNGRIGRSQLVPIETWVYCVADNVRDGIRMPFEISDILAPVIEMPKVESSITQEPMDPKEIEMLIESGKDKALDALMRAASESNRDDLVKWLWLHRGKLKSLVGD
jgi:hypothetical protein